MENEMQKPVQQFTRWQGSLIVVLLFGMVALVGVFFSYLFSAIILSVGTLFGIGMLFGEVPNQIPGNNGRFPAVIFLVLSLFATGYCWTKYTEHPTNLDTNELQIDSVAIGKMLKADSERLFVIEKKEESILSDYAGNVNKFMAGKISSVDMVVSLRKAMDATNRMYDQYTGFKPNKDLPSALHDTLNIIVKNISRGTMERRLSMVAFEKVLNTHNPSDMANMQKYTESSQTIMTQSGLALGFLLAQWKAN